MLLKGTRLLKGNGNFIAVISDNDIILKFTVQGTCFPSKHSQGHGITSFFSFLSANGESNKVFIDFNDGTGEHSYDFHSQGSTRRIDFRNMAFGTTPETVQGNQWYDADVYFYQDLPEGVKDTVVEEYPVQREVLVRFEYPQKLLTLAISYVKMFGVLPSELSKLRSLEALSISNTLNITSFAQDFYNSQIKNLQLTSVGSVMNQGFPLWILNSNKLESLTLNSSIDLSGNPVLKRFNEINRLKDSLLVLSLNSTGINYKIPAELAELENLTVLKLANNSSISMRFPDEITTLTALGLLDIRGTRMPFSEVKRIIEEIPNLNNLNISDCNYSSDFDIDEENNNIKTISIGSNSWNSGAVPSFITKLTALKTLNISYTESTLIYNNLTSYGDFSGCTNLETLAIQRLTNFTATIPSWFNSLTKLKAINVYASFQNTGGINSYVNNFYDFIVLNASMSVGSTPFRNMTINAYGSIVNDQNNSTRPSGTYQEPSGFVLGSNNGTPASQMEKIWVMVNQYGHTWTVKPA